jgi:hypothetical protein
MDRIAGEQWEFVCERTGAWRWRRRAADAAIVARATRAFASLGEALEDAARNGFTYRAAIDAAPGN